MKLRIRPTLTLSIVLAILITGGSISTARAQSHNINGNSWCGTSLTDADATYTLSADLTCEASGLNIEADGITIDGNGHTLTGSGAGHTVGLTMSNGINNFHTNNPGYA